MLTVRSKQHALHEIGINTVHVLSDRQV